MQFESDSVVEERQFMDTIWAAIYRLYGEYGASLTNLAPISFDGANKQAVLRANLAVVNDVRTAIASITSISGKASAVHVVAVSGTIKGLREKTSTWFYKPKRPYS
jgi:RNase P/RNase MRP subunit POP5